MLQKERAQERFDSLKSSLQDSALSIAEKNAVKAEYKKYLEKGLSKVDALETAIGVSGLHSKVKETSKKQENMRIPAIPGGKLAKDLSMDEISELEKKHGYGALRKMIPAEKLDQYDNYTVSHELTF